MGNYPRDWYVVSNDWNIFHLCLYFFVRGSNAGLGGISLAGSWRIEGDVTLPICSPLFDGHAAFVRLEISNGIAVKICLELKLNLSCFGVCLRLVWAVHVNLLLFNMKQEVFFLEMVNAKFISMFCRDKETCPLDRCVPK